MITPAEPRKPVRRRAIAIGGSLVAHLAMLMVLLTPRTAPPIHIDPDPILVQIVTPPKPPVPPAPEPKPDPEPPKAAPAKTEPKKTPKTPPKREIARETPAPPKTAPVRVARASKVAAAGDPSEVGEAELGTASVAGSGSGGGSCDMAGWLQKALAKDPKVREALAGANGKAIRVWNGQWVRHGDQDGAGLAAVREALTWEIAFAPKACRAQPVRGLVLFTLGDGARIVVGQAEWRWGDLLFARS